MKKVSLVLSTLLVLSFLAPAVRAQAVGAAGQVSEDETLINNILNIELTCTGSGYWPDPEDGTEDYEGATIGYSDQYKGCMVTSPSGAAPYSNSPEAYGVQQLEVDVPVTESGDYGYFASFYLWFWPCDSDTEDCEGTDGNIYSFEDPWGYLAYADDPAACELNGDPCYGPYDDENWVTNNYGMVYAYAGENLQTVGHFYVAGPTVEIDPSSDSLAGGESVTLTSEAIDTGGYLPFFS